MRRSSKLDDAQNALRVVEEAIGEPLYHSTDTTRNPISAYLSKIGRKGGLKGGKARAAKLSPRKRKEIASQAAISRWAKSKRNS
jgi:hypothetical protein